MVCRSLWKIIRSDVGDGQPKGRRPLFAVYVNLCFSAMAIIKAITVEHGKFNGRLYVDPMGDY